MLNRPSLSELAGCRRLCNGDSRYALVFEWNGLAVKVYRPLRHGNNSFSDPSIILHNTIEGAARLESAGVAHMPILDSWTDDDGNCFVVQPVGQPFERNAQTWELAKSLALTAYYAGVADVIMDDVMLYKGIPTIVDYEEIFDPGEDDWRGQDFAEQWDGF